MPTDKPTAKPQIKVQVDQEFADWLEDLFHKKKHRKFSVTIREVLEAGRRAIEAAERPAAAAEPPPPD